METNIEPDDVNGPSEHARSADLTAFSKKLGELLREHKRAKAEHRPSPFVAMACRIAERAEIAERDELAKAEQLRKDALA